MADPWLTIIGLGEDGPEGLSGASRTALEAADTVMGPPRHLALLPGVKAHRIEWPVPFADGIEQLMELRGQPVVVLASGDPFWFGAGSVITRDLPPHEWQAFPGASVFSLAASRLGWPLESTECLGLHAAPLTRLRPHLAPCKRLLVTLRDGPAVFTLAKYLKDAGFGQSAVTVLQALGGPRESIKTFVVENPVGDFDHPVCAAIDVVGDAAPLPLSSGRPDAIFNNDGQITKRPVRALTLSALAPRPYEHLWDIGGGSGSIGIEWLLSDPTLTATAIEPRADRAATIRANADRLGVDRLQIVTGAAPEALDGLPTPDVVFVGGGLGPELLHWLETYLPEGRRIVANAVTLETEALLVAAHARLGGDLMRVEIAHSGAIGPKRGWKASYPIVQWSHTL